MNNLSTSDLIKFCAIALATGFLIGIPVEDTIFYYRNVHRACESACSRRGSEPYQIHEHECICRDENNQFIVLHSDLGAMYHE